MAIDNSSNVRIPELPPPVLSGGEEMVAPAPTKQKWWNKIIDVKEAKNQILFSLPMIVVNGSIYFINLVSVMFAGHLGKLELAASNLGNSWAMVSGFSFMLAGTIFLVYVVVTVLLSRLIFSYWSVYRKQSLYPKSKGKVGLSGALETLCGQGFGAGMYRMLGIHLQTSCIISFFFSIVIAVIWWYSDMILILLRQDPEIAKEAGVFLKFLMPGLFAYGLLQNIVRFLQTQLIILPLVVCSLGTLVIHIGIAYALVHWTSLAFKGASLAASISIWIAALMLGLYVFLSSRFNHIWDGFSLEPFRHIFTNLKLALPSAAMVCLEYWAFELLVLLAGLMKNSETTTSVVAMSVNTETIAYMISYGLSAAASTRVANELGAGNPDKAKHAMAVTLKLSIILALIVDLALYFGHNAWAALFSDSAEIISKFASMTPLLLISFVFDFFQGILSGVARGCGWQRWAMCINFATFYAIGMPIAVVLAFKYKLQGQGLWVGLICGLACQASGLFLLTLLIRWKRVEGPIQSNGEIESQA